MKSAQEVVYPSAARTATPTAITIKPGWAEGLHVIIDVTAVTATPSVVCTVDALDGVSGKYYTLLTAAAVTATGTTQLSIGRGLTNTANVVANDFIPKQLRVTMTHADADSITYTVGVVYFFNRD